MFEISEKEYKGIERKLAILEEKAKEIYGLQSQVNILGKAVRFWAYVLCIFIGVTAGIFFGKIF